MMNKNKDDFISLYEWLKFCNVFTVQTTKKIKDILASKFVKNKEPESDSDSDSDSDED